MTRLYESQAARKEISLLKIYNISIMMLSSKLKPWPAENHTSGINKISLMEIPYLVCQKMIMQFLDYILLELIQINWRFIRWIQDIYTVFGTIKLGTVKLQILHNKVANYVIIIDMWIRRQTFCLSKNPLHCSNTALAWHANLKLNCLQSDTRFIT